MEIKKVLEAFGLQVDKIEELTDEELQSKIDEQVNKQKEHISTLEGDKEKLSEANQELTTSVEGYKSREEKLVKELGDTRTELATTKGKLEQVTSMYKEQFNKPDNANQESKVTEKVKNDILDLLAGA